MTTGQLLFYGGAGLLGFTVLLAIVFLIKKPQYRPENEVYTASGKTAPLRNGYPTDPMTVRRDRPEGPGETVPMETSTVLMDPAKGETAEMPTVLLEEDLAVPPADQASRPTVFLDERDPM